MLSLFDRSGVMVRPWADAGYRAVCVDIEAEPGDRNGVEYIRSDLRTWVPPRSLVLDGVAFLAAFPPCDHLAVSGNKWKAGKGLGALADSIRLFERAAFWAEWFEAPYLIENPVSQISTYWRKPDHTFHPWHYTGFCLGDNYTKKTCLWTGGGFRMPKPNIAPGLPEPDDRIHKAAPGPERARFRSQTPTGFAQAVFEANR